MLRLAGFFVLAVLLAQVLGYVPLIGPLFQRTGCLGIWVSAILLSWAFTRYGERAYRIRRDAGEIRRLIAVDSPHTQGKLGSMYLAQGRARKAIAPLELAVQGEPDAAEWRYRLGSALLSVGEPARAIEELGACVALDEEYAYGAAMMRLAEAHTRLGQAEPALEALRTFERNHGPSPESAYRRGVAHRRAGRASEARTAFGEVGELAREAARYQRKSASGWVLRAQLAKSLGL